MRTEKQIRKVYEKVRKHENSGTMIEHEKVGLVVSTSNNARVVEAVLRWVLKIGRR